jgi:hypothetical protein
MGPARYGAAKVNGENIQFNIQHSTSNVDTRQRGGLGIECSELDVEGVLPKSSACGLIQKRR